MARPKREGVEERESVEELRARGSFGQKKVFKEPGKSRSNYRLAGLTESAGPTAFDLFFLV